MDNHLKIEQFKWNDKLVQADTRLRAKPSQHENPNGENYDYIVRNIFLNDNYQLFIELLPVIEDTLVPYTGLNDLGARVEPFTCGIWWLKSMGINVL